MTEEQYLLGVLAEECAELAQRCIKAQRFGLMDRRTTDPTTINTDTNEPTNVDRICEEFNDILAVVQMLKKISAPFHIHVYESMRAQMDKQHRVRAYMNYSRKLGQLTQERSE
jgi:hypothetical protein